MTRTTPNRSIIAPANGASQADSKSVTPVVKLTSPAVALKSSMNRGNRFCGTQMAMPFVKKYIKMAMAAIYQP